MFPSAIGPGRIEPLPVEQGIAVVAEDRRPGQPRADIAERHGDVPRQDRRRLLPDLVHVGRGQEPQPHVVEPELGQRDRPGGQAGMTSPRARPGIPCRAAGWAGRGPGRRATENGEPDGNATSGSCSGKKPRALNCAEIMGVLLSVSGRFALSRLFYGWEDRKWRDAGGNVVFGAVIAVVLLAGQEAALPRAVSAARGESGSIASITRCWPGLTPGCARP